MPGRFRRSPVPSPSSIAAMTEDSSPAPAARPSRLSMARRRHSDRAVLQPRRQEGRDGERDPRRSPGQRHRHHGGRGRPDLEDGRRRRRLRRRARLAERDRASTAGSTRTIVGSTNDGNSYAEHHASMARLRKAGPTSRPSRPIPNAAGGVYVSSNLNLWRSTDGGSTWPNKAPIPGSRQRRRRRAGEQQQSGCRGRRQGCWSRRMRSATFTLKDITRNLPGRFVARVAFDPNDPATIYAVLGGFSGFPGGHVFRTTLAATTWTDISPPIDLPFNALALDGSGIATAIYAGTDFGVLRSVDGGASWSVLDDIHFPGAPVFDLAFHNGELRAATFGRGVFSFVKPTGPSIAVGLRRRPRLRNCVPGIDAFSDDRGFQRRGRGSRHHQRAAPHGLDRLHGAAEPRDAAQPRSPARISISRSPLRRPG